MFVLYGALGFEVSALEVFSRFTDDHQGPRTVDVCPRWRGTLISAPARSRLFDLTDAATTGKIGATPRLGDTNLDAIGYSVPQGWARALRMVKGLHGLRYFSCRTKDRGGIAIALFRKASVGAVRTQHRLQDDALWPYLVWTLNSVDVAVREISSSQCGRCRR